MDDNMGNRMYLLWISRCGITRCISRINQTEQTKPKMTKMKKYLFAVAAFLALALNMNAQVTDAATFAAEVEGQASSIIGYVAGAMGAALGIFALFMAGRLTLKGFRTIAK